MGLCKCPKKKVTNLFCFEHRVNVCEYCLVQNHPSCIVQSYLQWLQDSDYNPNCTICNSPLPSAETVRLLCLDVFHWKCLDQLAKQLPETTAPAGYTCPLCSKAVIPGPNHQGPVADQVKQQLAKVNWARAGLGLPLIDEPPPDYGTQSISTPTTQHTSSIINVAADLDGPTHHSRQSANVPRRGLQEAMFSTMPGQSHTKEAVHDHDEDKYKRRGPLDFAAKWLGSRAPTGLSSRNASTKRRFIVLGVLAVLGFMTLIIIFTRLGQRASENDPFLDPLANPNIHVADSKMDTP